MNPAKYNNMGEQRNMMKTFACIFTIARRTSRDITHNVISSFLKPRELCNAMIGLSFVYPVVDVMKRHGNYELAVTN